jgi:two-component system chemotaxis response regulator CheY
MAIAMNKLRVLVVDDTPHARDLTMMFLTGLGVHQVHPAADGREAQEFLEYASDRVDLIICDWHMPGMTGLELLQKVRAINPDMPFIMVTGNTDIDAVQAAGELAVSAYIRKPYSPQQFKEKLMAVLDKL